MQKFQRSEQRVEKHPNRPRKTPRPEIKLEYEQLELRRGETQATDVRVSDLEPTPTGLVKHASSKTDQRASFVN